MFANNLDFEELEENGKKYEIILVFAALKVDGSVMNELLKINDLF